MKAVILAGGLGTRLSEETELKPKPMVEIGGRPLLWHIMRIYTEYDQNDLQRCIQIEYPNIVVAVVVVLRITSDIINTNSSLSHMTVIFKSL